MRHAIEAIPAGSVFVLDMRGDLGCGALGDVLVSRLIAGTHPSPSSGHSKDM